MKNLRAKCQMNEQLPTTKRYESVTVRVRVGFCHLDFISLYHGASSCHHFLDNPDYNEVLCFPFAC
jgi:hypothetical protein